jgi:FkbM family methyltransferase
MDRFSYACLWLAHERRTTLSKDPRVEFCKLGTYFGKVESVDKHRDVFVSIVSYAQNFEDVMLWRALRHITPGYYIDVGAQDPIVDSVTKAFHENGWHGIHVEPTPHYANLLRRDRASDVVVQAAVGLKAGVMSFFEINGTGISTADTAIAQQHRERGFVTTECTVPVITMADVFELADSEEVHWLKIDVEGYEKQVIQSWGKSAARPWIVVVESTLPLTQTESHGAWEKLLLRRGYELAYWDGLNRFYISVRHPELAKAFKTPPNVFDEFKLNGTASATFQQQIVERFNSELLEAQSVLENARSRIGALQAREHALEAELVSLKGEYEKVVAMHAQTTQRERETVANRDELAARLKMLDARLTQQSSEAVERERSLAEKLLSFQSQAARDRDALSSTLEQKLYAELQARAALKAEVSAQLQSLHTELAATEAKRLALEQARADQVARIAWLESAILEWEARYKTASAELLARQSDLASQAQLLVIREQETSHEIAQILRQLHASREEGAALAAKLDHANREHWRQSSEWSKREEQLGRNIVALELALAAQRDEHLIEIARVASARKAEVQSLLAAQSDAQKLVQAAHDLALRDMAEMRRKETAEYSARIASHKEQKEALAAKLESLQIERDVLQRMRAALTAYSDTLRGGYSSLQTSASWRLTKPLRWLTEKLKPSSLHTNVLTVATGAYERHFTALDALAQEALAAPADYRNARVAERILPAARVHDLLNEDNGAFVECMYWTLLGREPDEAGRSYYSSRLQAGVQKMQIITEVRDSDEAREKNFPCIGLDAAIRNFRQKLENNIVSAHSSGNLDGPDGPAKRGQ